MNDRVAATVRDLLTSLGAVDAWGDKSLCEPGVVGSDGWPIGLTDAVWRAGAALSEGKREAMILAVNGLDSESMHVVNRYSHLAAHRVDADDYAIARLRNPDASRQDVRKIAEERHAAREIKAMHDATVPQSVRGQLRTRLLDALAILGVKIHTTHMHCTRQLATHIRSRRHMQSVIARLPHRRDAVTPHLRVIEGELRSAGVLGSPAAEGGR